VTERTVVLDTSAVFAILLGEEQGHACEAVLVECDHVLISAGTLSEMLIVAAGKDRSDEVSRFLRVISPEIVPLTATRAHAAARGYRRWGKTFHPAALNICDSFANALAQEFGCPLLYVGNDFAQTDIVSARSAD
jgi:ribonuclease VapC